MPVPLLIVVSGPPGSGKTSLAHRLARAIRCPAICRDEIKEGLVNTIRRTGVPGGDIAWRTYEIFFATVQSLLESGITLVAEAAFQHELWVRKLEPLGELAAIRIIHCQTSLHLRRSRIVQRHERDPLWEGFHEVGAALSMTAFDPPKLAVPSMVVDTSDGCSPRFDEVVAFASH